MKVLWFMILIKQIQNGLNSDDSFKLELIIKKIQTNKLGTLFSA